MKQKIARYAHVTALLIIIFIIGITFAKSYQAKDVMIPKVFGEEVEDGDDEGEKIDNNDEDNDDDKDDDENENEAEEEDNDSDEDGDSVKTTEVRSQYKKPLAPTANNVKKEDGEDEDENENEDEDFKELQELREDIAEAEADLREASLDDPNVAQVRSLILEAKDALVQAQTFAASSKETAKTYIKSAEQKLKAAKELLEKNKKDDDEDIKSEEAKTYRNSVSQFVHDLKDIEGIEGIGQQVRLVAQQQNETKGEVEKAIDKIKTSNKIVRFLIGEDGDAVGSVSRAIDQNANAIVKLQTILETTSDQSVAEVLNEQIQALRIQNESLLKIKSSGEKFSLFGWFKKLFI